MSADTMTISPHLGTAATPTSTERLRAWFRDTWIMARRNLIHVRREPAQLSDATIQPVLFTVLFVSIFSASMVLPGGGSAKDYLLPGLLALNLTTSTIGTAVGLSTDMNNGIIDRLRTLPMSQASVLIGRSLSDLLSAMLCASMVMITGLAIGWRTSTSAPSVIAGIAIVIFFAYAISWMCACIGLLVENPETAQAFGFIILFPLAFVSNAFAPTQGMPAVLQTIANWNPVSAVTAAMRVQFGNPNPSGAVDVWPMQHPVAAALIWSALILVVCSGTATVLYRRRTAD